MASIDQRIVSMKFDNAQFESGVKTSLGTLEKLKNSLNFSKSAQSLEELQNKTKGFSVSSVTDGLNTLELRFNALGIAAATVISNITTLLTNKLGNALKNTIGLIYSGGLRRATNLEQARFSMQGLLYDTETTVDGVTKQIEKYGFGVEDIMREGGPVQNAVKDTAYGLDEAAKAASNFIASGITDLGELENTLKSISGTAAQTGGSYEEIAHIYQRIAGNNRVYAIDLQSFAARGVNAAAALRDYLNKVGEGANYTEADIREMVSAGEVDLKTFSAAMYDAFGENAFRANETYAGSLSNLKAALSRLGAKFETKKLENMRDIFNALRPSVDALSKALDPIINKLVELSTNVSKFAVGKIEKVTEALKSFAEGTKFKDFELEEEFERLSQGMSKVEKMELRKKLESQVIGPMGRITRSFDNVVSAIKVFGSSFGSLFSKISESIKGFGGSILDNFNITLHLEALSFRILNLSKSFKNFIENGEPVKKVVNTIGLAFKALESVVTIIFNVFINFVNFLKTGLSPVFSILASSVHGIVTTFAGFIKNVADLINRSNVVYLFFNKLSLLFQNVLAPVLKTIADRFGFIGSTIDSSSPLANALNFIYKAFEKVLNAIVGLLSNGDDFKSWGEAITRVLNKVFEVLSPLGNAFTNVKEKIVDFFKGFSFNKIFGGDSDISLVEKAANVLETFLDILSRVLKRISETFSFADVLKVGILAKLGFGASGLAVIFKELESIYELMSGFFGRVANFKALQLRELALTLLIFVGAIAILSLIDTKKMLSSLLVFEILLTSIEDFLLKLTSLKIGMGQAVTLERLSASLIPLGLSILAFAAAIRIVAKLEPSQLINGLATVEILMLSMMSFLESISKFKTDKTVKVAGTLLGLAVAIDLLVIAVKKLGETDVEVLMKGLTSVGLLLTGLMIFTKFSDAGNMGVSSGAGLLLLATSLVILTSVVRKLGEMSPEVLVQGLFAIGTALLALGVFTQKVSDSDALKVGAALLVSAVAIVILASAIKKLAEIEPMGLANALITVAGSLAVIAAVLALLPKDSIAGAGAIIIAAAGIRILAGALKVLSEIPADKLVTAILGMAAGLAVMGALSAVLQPLAGAMILLSGAMALFGVGLLAAAVAIGILTPIMVAFSVALIGSLEIILGGIVSMGDLITRGILTIISSILTAISKASPQILETIVSVATVVLEGIMTLTPLIFETIGTVLTELVEFLVTFIPYLADAGLRLITGLLTAIRDNIQDIVVLGLEIIANFINGLALGLPLIIEAGFNLIISFINGIANSIRKNAERLGEAGWNLVSALVEGIILGFKGFYKKPVQAIREFGNKVINKLKEVFSFKKIKEIGSDIVEGIKSGIGGKIESAVKKAKELGDKILGGIKNFLGINSPSTKFKEVGKDIINGLNGGIEGNQDTAVGKVQTLGQKIFGKFQEFFGGDKTKKFGADSVSGIATGMDSKYGSVISESDAIGKGVLNSYSSYLSSGKTSPYGASAISGLSSGMSSQKSTAVSMGSIISDAIRESLMNYTKYYNLGVNAMIGFEKGVKNRTPETVSVAAGAGNQIIKKLEYTMQVKSPSRVFMRIGEYCMEGFAIGLSDTGMAEKNIDSLRSILSNSLEGTLSDLDSIDPTIRPILDLSDVEYGSARINSMLSGDQRLLGSISSNFNMQDNLITSAIAALTDRLNQKLENELTPDDIYNAIKEGAENASFTVLLDGRRLTSVVNENNSDILQTNVGFI